jgi:hypothetical protein
MVRRRYTENPRTVLGFFATVLGLILAADIAAVATLAYADVKTGLIPWLLGFAGVVFVALVGAVLVIALVDPSKLMLGRVTGSEYAEIQRLTLGDSRAGERELPVTQAGRGAPIVLGELPPGGNASSADEPADTESSTDGEDHP